MNNALLIILISFWKGLIFLPRFFHLLLSDLIGFLIYLFPLKRNKYSKININICFSNKTKIERNKIFKRNILLSGRVLLDTGVAWFWSDSRINKSIPYKINIKEINNIFINQGPGKFSGIRTSISTAKALSFANKLNLYGFDSVLVKNQNYDQIIDLFNKGLLIKNLIKPQYSS